MGAQEAAGVVRQILIALEKPIYCDQMTTTVTRPQLNKKGEPTGAIVTTVHTKGWTIPLGLPVLIVGSIAAWEIGVAVAQGLSKVEGAVIGVVDQLNPANWVKWVSDHPFGILGDSISSALGSLAPVTVGGIVQIPGSDGTTTAPATILVPPSFMAALSALGVSAMIPGSLAMQKLIGMVPPSTS
jgi:hypothetical protein